MLKQLVNCLHLSAASGLIILSVMIDIQPAKAQADYTCYEVSDPDGWVNLRDRRSNEVVTRADNGTYFWSGGETRDGWAVMAFPYDSLIVHPNRLKRAPDRFCESYVVSDRDGYVNLRQSPNGKVIGTVADGKSVLVTGRSGDWWRILTNDYRVGFVHSSRLR